MAIREFTDSTGTRWVVWSTLPTLGGLPGEMRQGWLTFDSVRSRRRVMPIPEDWEDVSPAQLEALSRTGVEVRRTLPDGVDSVEKRG